MSTNPLALDPSEFRRLGYAAVDLAADYLSQVAQQPVFTPMTEQERDHLMSQTLPDHGLPPDAILASIRDQVLAHPMGNGHPRFFGWVNSGPSSMGILADLLAATLNPSSAGGDHAAIYIERCAVRWLMELLGFPTQGSMGLLVSGGSMASLTCLTAARYWAAKKDGWDVRGVGLQHPGRRLVMYVSEECHSCVRKAADLLGLGAQGVRTIPVDADFRMNLEKLREGVDRDRRQGFFPFCVVGSAGTVNTGAIDPLADLADFCEAESLWLHIDGAYGGAGILDPAIAPKYRGLERARSMAFDPHKTFSVPVECGCALVRQGSLLRDTFSLVPSYLRTEEGKGFGGLPWYSEYGIQQTRGFRALKLWATLLQAGRAGLTDTVQRYHRLAQLLASFVDAAPELERVAPVELSVVCFRYVPTHLRSRPDDLNALNKTLVETLQSEGRAFVSSTTLKGRFVLRACVLNYNTTEQDIRALVRVVLETGSRLTAVRATAYAGA